MINRTARLADLQALLKRLEADRLRSSRSWLLREAGQIALMIVVDVYVIIPKLESDLM